MLKRLAVVLVLSFALLACVARPTYVGTPRSGRLTIVSIDDFWSYVIDPASETCGLVHDFDKNYAIMPVSCEALARNLPEAAKVITWVAPAAPAATAPAAPAPAAP